MSLQNLIRDLGMKQGWIANQIGLDDSTFSRIMRGRSVLEPDKIKPLARAMRIPVARVREALQMNGITHPASSGERK